MWSAYASLAESENRQAFARTIRAVIDPGGQTVSAMDRLYLASPMPTLIIWGDRDDIIPVSHAHAAHQAIPGSRLVIIEGLNGTRLSRRRGPPADAQGAIGPPSVKIERSAMVVLVLPVGLRHHW